MQPDRFIHREVRRTAQAAYLESRARPGRSMWLRAGEVDGTVISLDDSVFTVLDTLVGSHVRVAMREVEDWGVETASGFCLGPWVADELPMIEDVEDRWDDRPARGAPVCDWCGRSLDAPHECGQG